MIICAHSFIMFYIHILTEKERPKNQVWRQYSCGGGKSLSCVSQCTVQIHFHIGFTCCLKDVNHLYSCKLSGENVPGSLGPVQV